MINGLACGSAIRVKQIPFASRIPPARRVESSTQQFAPRGVVVIVALVIVVVVFILVVVIIIVVVFPVTQNDPKII